MKHYTKVILLTLFLSNILFCIDIGLDNLKYPQDFTTEIRILEQKAEQREAVLAELKDKDIVAFLGYKGSGKSTFINMLMGIPLVIPDILYKGKVIKLDLFELSENVDKDKSMPIGRMVCDGTIYPKTAAFNLTDGNAEKTLYLVDLPGLNDPLSTVVDIVDLVFLKKMLENAKSARFVFITSMTEIHSLVCCSRNLLFSVFNLFTRNHNIINNSLLVLMRSPNKDLEDVFDTVVERYMVDMERRQHQIFNNVEALNIFRQKSTFFPICSPSVEGYQEFNQGMIKNFKNKLLKMTPFCFADQTHIHINVDPFVLPHQHKIINLLNYSMQLILNQMMKENLKTLSEIEEQIAYLSCNDDVFWEKVQENILKEKWISLLKDFYQEQYDIAFEKLWDNNLNRRQEKLDQLLTIQKNFIEKDKN